MLRSPTLHWNFLINPTLNVFLINPTLHILLPQRTALRLLPELLRAMARTSTGMLLDADPHLVAGLRQLLGAFLELPPARPAESTAEVALRRALVATLLPWNHPAEGAQTAPRPPPWPSYYGAADGTAQCFAN